MRFKRKKFWGAGDTVGDSELDLETGGRGEVDKGEDGRNARQAPKEPRYLPSEARRFRYQAPSGFG